MTRGGLAGEYRRQLQWRDWATALDALPPLEGATVLDLGCGVGDLAAELVARGARVVGVDANEQLLREARARKLSGAEFHGADLKRLQDLGVTADGIWCSFAAAYFPDLPAVLAEWGRSLTPGGWIALTEVDDMFGHEPLGAGTKAALAAYAEDALAAGRYDFHMGRKLRGHLERAGFAVSQVLTLQDRELSFAGPALPEVLEAWRNRLRRMKLLRDFCGAKIDEVEKDFLDSLAHADHRSLAKVYCCVARK